MSSERAARFVEDAYRLTELGWALIRLDGKIPRGKDWQCTEPLGDPHQAAGTWAEWGKRWNMGVVLGPSRLSVLEYDDPAAEPVLLELLGGEWPTTPRARTGSGRRHVYFEAPPNGVTKAARDGLELRLGAHQCVVPPSEHPETGVPYSWEIEPWASPLVPVPADALAYFAGAEDALREQLQTDPDAKVRPGKRREHVFRLACSMVARGVPPDAILTAALAFNETRCEPPLDPLQVIDQVDGAVGRYDPATALSSDSDSGFRSIEIEPAGIGIQELPVVPDSQSSSGATTGKSLPFQPLAVLVESAPAEPEWTWQGYLARFTVALLAGRPKVGKSTLMMALVAGAVQGEAFLDLPAKSRGVLLLTEERRDTLAEKARILGLMDEELPVHVLTRGDVRDTPWPEVVRQAMTYCSEHELDVLVVDTLDRWTGLRGDAENAAGAVNEAMEPLLFAAAAGLAVLAVSHQRKSGGEYGEAVRGSNAFTGSVDVVIELERPSRSLQLGNHARVLRSVSRFASTPEELFLELGDDGFLPISDVAEKKTDAERAQVLDELENHDEPVSVDTLAEGSDLGKRAMRRRLTELRDKGLAIRSGEGKKGDPYLWAAVKGEDDEDGAS